VGEGNKMTGAMNTYDIKRLALVFSVQAEIEGMKALNAYREGLGQVIAYVDEDFFVKAEELRILAAKHNDQL
jgi:hypothetical protein